MSDDTLVSTKRRLVRNSSPQASSQHFLKKQDSAAFLVMMCPKRGYEEEQEYCDELKQEEKTMFERAAKARRIETFPVQFGFGNRAQFPTTNPQVTHPYASGAPRSDDRTMMTGMARVGQEQVSSSVPSLSGTHGHIFGSIGGNGGVGGASFNSRGDPSMQMFNQLNRHSFQSSLNMSGGGLNLGGQLSLEAAASDHGIDQLLIQNTQMTSQMMQSQNFRLQPSTFTSSLHHQLPNGNEMFQQSALLPSNNQQHSLSLPQPLFLHESLLLQEQQHQQQRHQQQLSDIDMSAFLTSSASLNEQLSSTFLLQQRRQQQQQQQQPQGQGQQQQPNFFDPSFILSLRNMPLQRTQQQQHQQQRLPILNIPTSSREFDNNRVSRSSNLTGADLSSMMALAQLPNTSSGNPSSTPTEDIYTPVPLLRRAYGRTEPMARPSDESSLSAFQAYARQQIEFFEAVEKDVSQGARGRNVPISLGQVGIRCRHCRDDGPKFRGRAGVYFPTKFELVYQTAVNMTSIHLCQHCTKIPTKIRTKLLELRDQRSTAGGGKSYWAKATKDMGVVETKQGLRFRD